MSSAATCASLRREQMSRARRLLEIALKRGVVAKVLPRPSADRHHGVAAEHVRKPPEDGVEMIDARAARAAAAGVRASDTVQHRSIAGNGALP